MVNAQEWLDKNYPNELVKREVKELAASLYTIDDQGNQYEKVFKEELENSLIINNLINLKKLYLCSNKLTKLVIINCSEIELISCSGNFLADVNFLFEIDSKKLTALYLENNNISEQNLSCFEEFTNLTALLVGNSDKNKIKKGIYNRFTGSLEFLKDLTRLERLSIKNTDIDSGLEYLPSTIKEFHCLADQRAESGVKRIEEELKFFLISSFHGTYNFKGWREKIKGEASNSSEQEKAPHTHKNSHKRKAKRQISQKEVKYQKTYLVKGKEKEQQWFQQIEINPYKK